VRRLPANVDDERLLGGVDLPASLVAGRSVIQAGILSEIDGGVLLVPMAERLTDAVAGRLAQAIDGGRGRFGLVLLDDGIGSEQAPPPSLSERVAFRLDLSEARPSGWPVRAPALPLAEVEQGHGEALSTLATTATVLGIGSVRALLFALAAARAHAALHHRRALTAEDLQVAARLVLAPRATRLPPEPEPDEQEADQSSQRDPAGEADGDSREAEPSEDKVLEAALAALPPDLLARLAEGATRNRASGSGGGRKAKSKLRGKPLGARPGMPRGGARLALIDTLRAAVPWQPLRRTEAGATGTANLLVRKSDLRIRRFEDRSPAVTIFCVDASGSAAMARLAEAKGAVELMLAQAYVTRSEVALIAFRGTGAELLLPPTRSLTRARRALADLPGGGGTPLATGITAARRLGEAMAARGATPFLVFLTDGSANIGADGVAGRKQARADAETAAKAVAANGLGALVLDIAPRPRPEAEDIARVMKARYLPLPVADAAAVSRAVEAARPSPQPP
jgi:magnesium chelatase subunit D